MLTVEDTKEELSYAYVHAIATLAGFTCDRPFKDRDSIDIQISSRGQLSPSSKLLSPKIEAQVKATSVLEIANGVIPYPLKRKNFVDLRAVTMVPRILIVLLLPNDSDDWATFSTESLVTRRCAYWHDVCLEPDHRNRRSQTVYVPTKNIFSPTSLRQLMVEVSVHGGFDHGH